MSNSIGHGIGLRRKHYEHLLEHGASGIDWFETISENHFGAGGRPWAVLERVRRDVPVVLHGVGLGIGGVDPVSDRYLRSLQTVIDRVDPAWVSDHLCWGSFDGRYVHDLLPMPYTAESFRHVAARVEAVQARLGRRILLENISSYVEFKASDLAECDFLNALARKTGCGVLLDVNNLVVGAFNIGVDPARYIESLDIDIVGQIHVAGHTQYEDTIVDTHVGPVPDVVWKVYEHALRRFGAVPTLVEWDEDVPAFEVVADEARRAAAIERKVLHDAHAA